MNKAQKEAAQAQLKAEQKTLRELKQVYNQARKDCQAKIAALNARKGMEPENLQTIIYQEQYQRAIMRQIDSSLQNLNTQQYETIDSFLQDSYRNGYTGVMYDLDRHGIPLAIPIDQEQVARAVRIDSKISQGMYTRLGEDVTRLKNSIRAEVSRGILNGSTWIDVAGHIANGMNNPFDKAINNAVRIARTEGHRIQQSAALDAQKAAKKAGADVVKQWDSTLDGVTRPAHQEADGQIRDVEEPFFVDGEYIMAPGDGSASNCINCRCVLLQRAKWALSEAELDVLKARAEFYGLDKTDQFEEFKEKYLQIPKTETETEDNSGIIYDSRVSEQQVEVLRSLVNEYQTRLQEVTIGAVKSAGDVDISGAKMRLSDKHVVTAVHEFAHTMANTSADKYGLTNDKEFWKEIRKIYREYHKDVDKTQDSRRYISGYEHSSKSVDEFMAEAFAHAKMRELGIPMHNDKYGNDYTYSQRVLTTVNKYFKKRP